MFNEPKLVLNRRQFLGGLASSAAAAALSFVPESAIAAVTATPATVAGLALPPATDAITPFKVNVPQSAIDDLKRRLAATRWPDKETVNDWSQGVPLETAKSLVKAWQTGYDWRTFERRINALPNFRTRIDGLGIHFIHVRSKNPNALPIILTHGWPGSFIEFLDVIERLTDPVKFGGAAADSFDVVIPSLPGFAFSDKPTEEGWDVVRTAKAWGVLMKRLGYTKWVAQGGDWGSGVTHALAHVRPDGLIAAHVNWPFVFPETRPANPTPAEKQAYDDADRFQAEGSGYFREQATRPQTIGYALADSASGHANWIYEKFYYWTDNRGKAEDALTTTQMLDDISLYWFTDTAASSARFYWQNSRHGVPGFSAGRIELPMSASIFPHEICRAPKAWAEALWPNLFYWNEVEHGGHFAAFEQPQIFANELIKAFRTQRG